jgi:molybdopterin converting factor small subunit
VRVEVRLYATLAAHVARATAAAPLDVEIAAGSPLAYLIDHLGLPAQDVHLVVVDGRMVHDRSVRLTEGSRVALFPPVGGG